MIVEVLQGILYLCLIIFTIAAILHIHYERVGYDADIDIPQVERLPDEEVFPPKSYRPPKMDNKRQLLRMLKKTMASESKSDAIFARSCSSTESMPGVTPAILSQAGDLCEFKPDLLKQKLATSNCPHHCKCRACASVVCNMDCDKCET